MTATASTEALPESNACLWVKDGVVVNAFPHGVGEPAKWDRDSYWARKGYSREPLFTADQMHAHWTSSRKQALEEAAKECEATYADERGPLRIKRPVHATAFDCAAAIRKLGSGKTGGIGNG